MRQNAGRMETNVMKSTADRDSQPDRGFHSRDIGRQQIRSGKLKVLRKRQRAWKRGRGRVDDGLDVGIVEIKTVNENAVGERAVSDRQFQRTSNHRAIAASRKFLDAAHGDRSKLMGG